VIGFDQDQSIASRVNQQHLPTTPSRTQFTTTMPKRKPEPLAEKALSSLNSTNADEATQTELPPAKKPKIAAKSQPSSADSPRFIKDIVLPEEVFFTSLYNL
jgi:hypothetical protein